MYMFIIWYDIYAMGLLLNLTIHGIIIIIITEADACEMGVKNMLEQAYLETNWLIAD